MTTSAIYDLPTDSHFGLDFSYAAWTPNTTVTLCNVPWNADYRDIVKFNNQAALDNYIDNLSGPKVVIGSMTYAKMNRPVRLDLPFNAVNRYNYLRVQNLAQPITGDVVKSFYYFISDVQYLAPNCTEVMIQLDVWQSFGFGISFGNCYIEQGHIGIANENQMSDFGRDYLTAPEGLDIGGEYIIAEQWQRSIASSRGSGVDGAGENYSILITTTVSLDVPGGDFGTKENPNLITAKGSSMENMPNGAELYVIQSVSSFKVVMATLSDKPWITQGIVSIQAIPDQSVYGLPVETTLLIGGRAVSKVGSGTLHNHIELMASNWRNGIVLGPLNRYAWLKKFLTYPYSVLELTSYQGAPVLIKPESWNDPHAAVVEVPHFGGPGARIMFYPFRYNASSATPNPVDHPELQDAFGIVNDGGEFYDCATGIFNFPTFSIVNNAYISYMASNRNSIAYQHASADWSQQRALQGNQVSADQSTNAINTAAGQTSIGVDASRQSTILQNEMGAARAIQGMTTGAVMSAGNMAMGGPVGAGVGAVSAMANAAISQAIDMNQRNQQFGITAGAAVQSTNLANDQRGYLRDTNKGFADLAANGDYQNAIAGINAKVQDAKLIQPTTSGQMGGESFTLATYKWGYDLKLKMLQGSAMNSIGEYWLRYGYKINRFGHMPSNLMVMTIFTYWKLKETYITASNCPESFKQAIRGIFEKGVTVWNNPSDIGNIDIGNNFPVPGVTL